jgi:uncharacterized membrane protein YfcA
LSPVVANATNAVALVPGTIASAFAYRQELVSGRRHFLPLLVPSLLGGLVGAYLLLAAPEKIFEAVVPWLVLGATLLMVVKRPLLSRLGATGSPSKWRVAAVAIGIFLMGVYGGYFGAGIGIITLATLSLLQPLDIHTMNARKSVLTTFVNGAAAGLFIVKGAADLPAVGVMAAGSIAGGYAGARIARRVRAPFVNGAVIAIGLILTAILFARKLRIG